MVDLFYRKSEGSGTPIVIMHGLFGLSDNWAGMSTKLSNSGYQVWSVDLRNHGQSPHVNSHSYQDMVEDLEGFLNQHQIEKCHLIGHSMGGKVAMRFSGQHAERLASLTIVDISPRFYPIHHQEVLEALHNVPLTELKSRKEAETTMAESTLDLGTRQFLLKNLYWKKFSDGTEQLDWRFHLSLLTAQIGNVGEALPEEYCYDGPTLFISGENSNYIQRKDIDLINHHFPKAEFDIIPNAGHWVQAENPDGFYTSLTQFLNKNL